jgi:DNA-3-methyladenine glycosylase
VKPGRLRHGPAPLARAELPIDTAELARTLIGKLLVRELPEGVVSGRIVERGHAYVYLAYGASFMLNVSSEAPGIGAGVLIRALEPVEGVAIMRQNRGVDRLRDLVRGPGRLAQALRIDRSLDGFDLCEEGPLWLGRDDRNPGEIGEEEIGESIRIGISRDAERVLRFYLRGSLFVSGARALNG